jgi:hypothetical protein
VGAVFRFLFAHPDDDGRPEPDDYEEMRALSRMHEAADECLCGDWSRGLSADLWDRLRDKVRRLKGKVQECMNRPVPPTQESLRVLVEVQDLREEFFQFAARLPAGESASPREVVRDGVLYVNGEPKKPHFTPQQEELVNLVSSRGRLTNADLIKAGIDETLNALRIRANRCGKLLKEAGVEWYIKVHGKDHEPRYIKKSLRPKKKISQAIDRQ